MDIRPYIIYNNGGEIIKTYRKLEKLMPEYKDVHLYKAKTR